MPHSIHEISTFCVLHALPTRKVPARGRTKKNEENLWLICARSWEWARHVTDYCVCGKSDNWMQKFSLWITGYPWKTERWYPGISVETCSRAAIPTTWERKCDQYLHDNLVAAQAQNGPCSAGKGLAMPRSSGLAGANQCQYCKKDSRPSYTNHAEVCCDSSTVSTCSSNCVTRNESQQQRTSETIDNPLVL